MRRPPFPVSETPAACVRASMRVITTRILGTNDGVPGAKRGHTAPTIVAPGRFMEGARPFRAHPRRDVHHPSLLTAIIRRQPHGLRIPARSPGPRRRPQTDAHQKPGLWPQGLGPRWGPA